MALARRSSAKADVLFTANLRLKTEAIHSKTKAIIQGLAITQRRRPSHKDEPIPTTEGFHYINARILHHQPVAVLLL